MKNETREKFEAYVEKVAELNGVPSATVKFTATPTIQQTLETKMQESSDFLKSINIVGVEEMEAEKVGLGIGAPVASNTDTTDKDRQTKDPTSLDALGYKCRKNNSDTHLGYAKLDQWAKFKDFQTRIRDVILRRQALDRITIGFNGTHYAVDSDLATYPLLQDVNIGWFEKYRLDAPARVLDEVVAASGVIDVFAGGDYENLDALVFDAVNNLIDPWYRKDTQLVAIMGSDLLTDKYFPIINQQQPSSEVLASDMIISQKRVGGVPAVTVPFVPNGSILVTRLDNLSVYFQDGKRRRLIKDNPARDRIENYESSNDAYVIEDYGLGCLIENINTTAP